MARSSLGRPPLQSGRETKKKRKSRSYGALQGCTVRLSQGRGGFSKLRGVRERREAPRVGAQAEANEDERRGRERQLGRGGGGSCFERFHSSMVPDYPSFCYHTVRPCPPLLRLVRPSLAIRVLVALRHRPSIFLFDRFSLPAVPALHRPFAALCMCILACIRCEGWTGLD